MTYTDHPLTFHLDPLFPSPSVLLLWHGFHGYPVLFLSSMLYDHFEDLMLPGKITKKSKHESAIYVKNLSTFNK